MIFPLLVFPAYSVSIIGPNLNLNRRKARSSRKIRRRAEALLRPDQPLGRFEILKMKYLNYEINNVFRVPFPVSAGMVLHN